MKKAFLLLWTVLSLVFLSPPLHAQTNSTTVADGTATSQYIPVYGSYLNSYLHAQVIYPAYMLADMVGATISSMQFHSSAHAMNYSWIDTMQLQFSLGVTDTNTLPTPAAFLTEPTTPVYTGSISVVMGVMTIHFDSTFTYTGGNLLLDIATLVRGNYHSATFLGISTDNFVSLKGYNSGGIGAITNQIRYKFIPKTTFTYTGGVSCLSPNGVSVTDITGNSATMHIGPRNGQSSWEYLLVPSGADTTGMVWTGVTDTTVQLAGLTDNTAYTVYVRTHCGGEHSYAIYANFRTLCNPIAELPVTWDFESDNAGGTLGAPLPACWERTPLNTNYPKTYNYGTEYSHSGTSVLYFGSASGTFSVGSLPEIDTAVFPVSQLQVEFYARMRSAYYSAVIEVGVLDNATPNPNFQVYDSIFINTNAYPIEPYRVMFNQFTGSGNRIGFRMVNASSTITDLYIDDVTLSNIPACPNVQQLTADAATESTITVSWNGLNDSYRVRYREVSGTTWLYSVANTDSIVIPGLAPNTEYVIQVAPDCDTVTEEMYVQVTAWSACATLSTPYFIDFENDLQLHCWTVAQQSVVEDSFFGDSYYPAIETSSSYALSGIRYVELAAQSGSSAIIAAPKFEQDIETLRLILHTREPLAFLSPNVPGTLELGLMTDPYDTASFVVLDTIPVSGTTYTPQTFNFSQYNHTGPGYHIAFRYLASPIDTSDIGGIYIDDLIITLNASCDEPAATTVSNVTTTTADISWTSSAGNHRVYYQPVGATAYQSVTVPSGDSVVTLTGLQPSAHYFYYVSAVCSDLSEAPSLVGVFMTECGVHSVYPYRENFDTYASGALPDCWQRINGVNESGSFYPMTSMNTAAYHFASSLPTCFAFNSYGPTRSTAILPQFSEEVTNLRLAFDARPEDAQSGTLHVGYMTDPSDSSTFATVSSIATNDLVDYGYHHYIVDFNNTNAPSPAHIAFRYESQTDRLFFIDNVEVDVIPNCSAPIQLAASGITSTTANLSWNSNADSLVLYYKTAADTGYSMETILVDSESVYMLTGLTPSSTYTWYLTFLCENQEYVSATSTFTTDCAGITSVPVSWGFESGNSAGSSSNPLPSCWHRINSLHPYVYYGMLSNYAHTGSRSLLFNVSQGNLYAAIRPIDPDALSIDTLQLKFYARVYSDSVPNHLVVGVMEDPMDASTFVPVQTVNISSASYGTTVFRVNFDSYTGSGNHIAFRTAANSGGNIYVDDITLQAVPACVPVENLTVTDTSDTTATITWNVTGDITEFTVEHKTASATNWETQTVNALTATLTGLTPNTAYCVRVRPTCDPDIVFQVTSFTTEGTMSGSDTCASPTGLHTTNVENENIAIAWDANPDVNSWNIQYQPEGGNWISHVSNTNSHTITGLAGLTNYLIRVQADCGEGDLSAWSDILTVQTTNVGVSNLLANSITLFPNPAKEYVEVRVAGDMTVTDLEVLDVYGKLVMTADAMNRAPAMRLLVSGLADGMYFVRVTTGHGTVTKSFVKR